MISITAFIFFVVLIISIKKPGIGLVLLINTYQVRSLAEISWQNPCYASDCQIGPNIILGAILPTFSLFFIVLKTYAQNKVIKYPFDSIDALLLSISLILLIYSIFSPDPYSSIEYFIEYSDSASFNSFCNSVFWFSKVSDCSIISKSSGLNWSKNQSTLSKIRSFTFILIIEMAKI